ncbi:MAG TPA: hypothetical protein VJ739_08585 [Gemmataceae bacterium]|nr:hypothetical protein [Gemmataceae bacterium]
MASPFQQQALRRKLIYIGAIVALFTVALLFRSHVVEPRANALALRDEDAGSTELTGSAVRLTLTGLRGLAVCVLWNEATDKQKKNQWDEFEMLARASTKLQPHFITPWLWQSWNVSYNIAVKCDLPRDKYFYIARGIELLAEGERQNRYQPDLRFAMGTYYQQKIPMHDHHIPLMTLLEMSAIDPVHRDPEWLRGKDRDGRPRFETYLVERHPRLIRRMREKLGLVTQEQVLKYLAENRKIPSLFGDKQEGEGDDLHTRLKLNKEDPFPLLPQAHDDGSKVYDPMRPPDLSALGPEADGFALAREWFSYAQEPLPDPDPEDPGKSLPLTEPIKQRLPRFTTILFRNFPPRAQSYVAERLEEEGWFDAAGWKLPGMFRGDKFSTGEPAVIGTGRAWAHDAWERAHAMWKLHGERNNLIWPPEKEEALQRQAEHYRKAHNLGPTAPATPLRASELNDPEMVAGKRAQELLAAYQHYRMTTNIAYFYWASEAEAEPATVAARKALYEAEELRLAAKAQALPRYEAALKAWAKVLADHPEFRESSTVQEDSFESEWNYVQLFNDSPAGRVLKQQLFAQALLGQALVPTPASSWLSAAQLSRPQAVVAPVLQAPLDGMDSKGHDLLDDLNIDTVLRRKGQVHGPMMMPAGLKITPEMMQQMQRMGMPPSMLPKGLNAPEKGQPK